MNSISSNQEHVPVCSQPQSYLLNLPEEITRIILSFDPNDRIVLLACKSLYRIGFEAKDASINNQIMFVRAVCADDIPLFFKLVNHKKIDPSGNHNAAIKEASKRGNLNLVKELLKYPRVNPSSAIHWAISFGQVNVAKELLRDPRVNPSYFSNYFIRLACQKGCSKIVKFLLKNAHVNPSVRNNDPIRLASEEGHWKVVRVLLSDSRVNPAARNNFAIRCAIQKGYWQVVKELLRDPRVNPSSNYHENPVGSAIVNGHWKVLQVLIADSRVHAGIVTHLKYKIAIVWRVFLSTMRDR